MAGTPKATIGFSNAEILRYAADAESKKREQDGTIVVVGSTPEQFRQQFEGDARIWANVANERGIRPD